MGPPANAEEALLFLRLQLFTAAQRLKGEEAAKFWELIDDVNSIRDVAAADDVLITQNVGMTDTNAYERARLVQLMRSMMVDEYGWRGEDGNVAPMHYIAGRNDVLRQLCKHLEAIK